MTNDVSMTALRQPSATSVLATNSAVVDYSRIHHRTTELVASASARESCMRPERHLGGMPHLLIEPSKWDTSMETPELNAADGRRFLRHNLATGGSCSTPPRVVFKECGLANVHRPDPARPGHPDSGAPSIGRRAPSHPGSVTAELPHSPEHECS